MSGGQKRRVAIAGVIAMEPEVLILDEPTAGLDPVGRDEILSNIRAYHDAKNATIILVSHSMEEVAQTVDRVVVINDGTIPLTGTPQEVFSHEKELTAIGTGHSQGDPGLRTASEHGTAHPGWDLHTGSSNG